MEHESRHKLLSEKYDKLLFDNGKLQGLYKTIKSEHSDLLKFKSTAEY